MTTARAAEQEAAERNTTTFWRLDCGARFGSAGRHRSGWQARAGVAPGVCGSRAYHM